MLRHTVRFLATTAVVALSVASCSDGPSAPETTTGGLPATAAELTELELAAVAAGQEQHVMALIAEGEAAWDAGSAAGYAALFAEDVDFISPLGTYLFGREAVRAQHVLLFGGPFAGSTLDIESRQILFLTGTVAVVDLRYTLTGYRFLPPGLVATEPGMLRNLVRWVVVKRGGEWYVRSMQMTPVQPGV